MREHRAPLEPSREAGAAPAPQAGCLDLGERGLGSHLAGRGEAAPAAAVHPVLEAGHRLAGQEMQMLTHDSGAAPPDPIGVRLPAVARPPCLRFAHP